MNKRIGWFILILFELCANCYNAYSQQQDVDFHIKTQFFSGTKVLKVKRDFTDPYAWVLTENNGV